MSEAQAVVVASPFTQAHKKISQTMLETIVAQITQSLSSNEIQIKSYDVSDYTYESKETLSVTLDERTQVYVSVTRRRS